MWFFKVIVGIKGCILVDICIYVLHVMLDICMGRMPHALGLVLLWLAVMMFG